MYVQWSISQWDHQPIVVIANYSYRVGQKTTIACHRKFVVRTHTFAQFPNKTCRMKTCSSVTSFMCFSMFRKWWQSGYMSQMVVIQQLSEWEMLASFVLYLESNKTMLSKRSQWHIIVNISETNHHLLLCSLYSPA